MEIENPPSENVSITEIPPANPPAAHLPAPPASPPAPGAPPPAASLVNDGDVKSERELVLERQVEKNAGEIRELQRLVSEREQDIQNLTQTPAPTAPRPKKVKRSSWGCVGFRTGEAEE